MFAVGLQEDELTALEAIYGDDAVVSRAERCVEVCATRVWQLLMCTVNANHRNDHDLVCAASQLVAPSAVCPMQVHIPSISAQPKVVFKALLPVDYPSSSAPVFMLTAPHVSDDALMNAVSSMEDTFMPGEGMLYNSVEWLRGQADLWHSAKHLDDESDSDFGEGVEEVATVQV